MASPATCTRVAWGGKSASRQHYQRENCGIQNWTSSCLGPGKARQTFAGDFLVALNASMGPQQRVASSRSIRQVNQKNWNISACMENRGRENASRFLHQKAQDQSLDQRDSEKNRQTPAILDLYMERGEYDGCEHIRSQGPQKPPILFQEESSEPQFLS